MGDPKKAQSRQHGTWYPKASYLLVSTLSLLHSVFLSLDFSRNKGIEGKIAGCGHLQCCRIRAPPWKGRELITSNPTLIMSKVFPTQNIACSLIRTQKQMIGKEEATAICRQIFVRIYECNLLLRPKIMVSRFSL